MEDDLLFGGLGGDGTRKPAPGGPTWWQAMEQAYFQLTSTPEGKALYGDPAKGATLEQAYRAQLLVSRTDMVCLVSTARKVSTGSIPKPVAFGSAQLAGALGDIFVKGGPRTAIQIFVHDGRSGHSVTLLGFDPAASTFVFHDPWPGQSLLKDARRTPEGRWSIAQKELAAILVAAFVWPARWADHRGEAYAVDYAALQASRFWSAFGLREARREAEGDGTLARLRPGGFQSEVRLELRLDASNRVRTGTLGLRRAWIDGAPPPANPFPLDIAKGFLAALCPAPDQAAMAPFVEAFASLSHPQRLAQFSATAPTEAAELLQAYLGMQPQALIRLRFCWLDAATREADEEAWFVLRIDVD